MDAEGIITCIEEFAFYLYCNCTLDEYISKYEPIVIRGNSQNENIRPLDKHIDTKIEKDIYLYHDII
jgi:hypothetical protein